MTALIVIVASIAILTGMGSKQQAVANQQTGDKNYIWKAPDTSTLSFSEDGKLIRYGRDLIAKTSLYLGPKGTVAKITNGMNCQNCHLDAGTKAWGNNYGAVSSTYPRFRERSGTSENIYKRVNDCIERSLNGKALDTNSREMQAIYSYIKWLGQDVPRDVAPSGSGIKSIPFLSRAADPEKGAQVYSQHCQRCHGAEGRGLLNENQTMYVYPPLWGDSSYNTGAGLYRLSRFAGYVKDNMPFDAPAFSRHLTDEEAWDVAAFVNSQSRPYKSFPADWPNIAGKPLDHPFGPYADNFSEKQHKYGPFEPIVKAKKQAQKNK